MYTMLVFIEFYSVKVCEWPDVNMTYIVICVFRYSTGGRVWST